MIRYWLKESEKWIICEYFKTTDAPCAKDFTSDISKNVPQTWFRLKVKSDFIHSRTQRHSLHCPSLPVLGHRGQVPVQPYDEPSCASGYTCSPSPADDGREAWMRLEMYSSTRTLGWKVGWNERNSCTIEGGREESSLSVYILLDSLAHGGSSVKCRHENHGH